MVEALIVGALCLLGMSYVFICGIKIIKSTIEEEKLEEQFLQTQKL